MKQGKRQADVGLYLRIPVELDRRLHMAAAAQNGGFLPRGAIRRFVLEVLTGGLAEREDPRRHARKLRQIEEERAKGEDKSVKRRGRANNARARIAARHARRR